MNRQILLINDMAGYGKVALSAMIPVLSHMGVNIYNLPTALVSNTLDYGKFEILDTTSYMKNTIKVWDQLGFNFDAISTGFIVGSEQAEMITKYCLEKSKLGVKIFCDPIMGDEGHLYNGMTSETVENMKKLVSCADFILPNYTEGCFLSGETCFKSPTKDDVKRVINKLRNLGAGSVVLTSTFVDGVNMVSCFDASKDEYFDLPYESLDVRFPGTGDIFSAIFIGMILNDKTMKEAVQKAMDVVKKMMELNLDNKDKFKGIQVEACLNVIGE